MLDLHRGILEIFSEAQSGHREWYRGFRVIDTEYYYRNKARCAVLTKQWRQNNALYDKARKRAWKLANPDKVREQKRRAYARKRGLL